MASCFTPALSPKGGSLYVWHFSETALKYRALGNATDITEADARPALQQLDPLWDELFPAKQARVVSLIVKRVDIGTERLNVRLRLDGLGGLAREMLAGDIGAAA